MTVAPTPPEQRSLAPDLARGAMLLFIALANSHYFLRGDTAGVLGGYPRDVGPVDAAVVWAVTTFVDGRAFPMFGLLFGYGVAQVVARWGPQLGPRGTRRLLWRRSLVLVAVGFLHAVLLFPGDILTAYGVLLLVGAWTVRWHDRWLLVVAALFFAMLSLPGLDSYTVSELGPDASMLPPDLLAVLTERPVVSGYVALLGPVGFACPFLVGLWAGRRRVLQEPAEHRRLLVVTAVVGIAAAVAGAQPIAVVLAGWAGVPGDDVLELVGPLHDATGVLGGFGYAALVGLVALRLGDRRPRWAQALAATGQRSMTCYLGQSVVWAVAFTPFLLDLSGTLTVTSTAVLATAAWLATVVLADRMARAGRRGPFEVLVRRVAYSRIGTRTARSEATSAARS
ncbi:DUF418 domain-containing protein [Nocardioides sp.]|uniref:DUF418 domain-containing protein n=1 Tax=Nocardioides sp. TaxID=35761 RepID=UPI002722DF6E|nr:DUF418 domain-containing protein [Nocardioides sp.]MDO9454671.1 DUF418 domain-containing protein [Nocardioides sp.]